LVKVDRLKHTLQICRNYKCAIGVRKYLMPARL
jgi:hypothetical protein